MSFAGFDPTTLALLAELPGWDSDRYDAHRHQLKTGVSTPGRELITAVADHLPAELTVSGRASVSPLHRDLRFAAAGSPRYKDHLLLTTWHGADKRVGATLWLRIDASRVGFASGISLDGDHRDRWRAAIGDERGAALTDAIDTIVASTDADVAGEQLTRVPRPYPPDHPRADLLRHKGIQVRYTAPLPDTVGSAEFGPWCAERLGRLLPIHRWFVEHIETETSHG
ncbi:MAG: DUF2461 family protein [Actinomycetota bacterium]